MPSYVWISSIASERPVDRKYLDIKRISLAPCACVLPSTHFEEYCRVQPL